MRWESWGVENTGRSERFLSWVGFNFASWSTFHRPRHGRRSHVRPADGPNTVTVENTTELSRVALGLLCGTGAKPHIRTLEPSTFSNDLRTSRTRLVMSSLVSVAAE